MFFSFYNWETQTSTSNPSPNYLVMAQNATGLIFKNKRDRKQLIVDPKVMYYRLSFKKMKHFLAYFYIIKDLGNKSLIFQS